jgi:DUF4097 and DUF4098 domain-containing protein YvlB
LTTVSGGIEATGLVGVAHLRSTSGKIDVGSSLLESFNVNTVSGGTRLETPLNSGNQYVVGTVSGSVLVEVPPETGATVTLRSVSGEASFDLPAQVINSGRRSWQGILNGGGATLEVHSVSGSLRVTGSTGTRSDRRSASTPADVGVPIPTVRGEGERLELLRRLQQGEITLEQAMEELG